MEETGHKTCCATSSLFTEHWEGEGLRRDRPPRIQSGSNSVFTIGREVLEEVKGFKLS